MYGLFITFPTIAIPTQHLAILRHCFFHPAKNLTKNTISIKMILGGVAPETTPSWLG